MATSPPQAGNSSDSSPAPELTEQDRRSLAVATRGDWTVIRLQDASMMDVQVIERLHGQIRQLVEQGCTRLILDFKKVEYISSSMVGVLVALQQDITKRGGGGGRLILSALNNRLAELLRLTRLESMFQVEPDARTALKKVGAPLGKD